MSLPRNTWPIDLCFPDCTVDSSRFYLLQWTVKHFQLWLDHFTLFQVSVSVISILASIFFISALFIVHVSEVYKATLQTSVFIRYLFECMHLYIQTLETSTTLTRHSAGGHANCRLNLECDVMAGALHELLLTDGLHYTYTTKFTFNSNLLRALQTILRICEQKTCAVFV